MNYERRHFLITLIMAVVSPITVSGETQQISLEEAIALARTNSVEASVALNELKSAYWGYRTYRAELLPEVIFKATVPSYHKQYASYMDDSGSYSFVRTNYLEMNGELSVTQNIWLTGGTLSLNTSLDFMRQLDGDKYNRFMSIPLVLTLDQPLFAANNLKWSRKIEPLRYKEAQARFLSETEGVALTAINYYFSLLMAMETQGIARQNLENASRLYEVAKEKRAIGQISQNDLLQMELNLLNAQSAMTDADSNYKSAMFQLRSFLDIAEDIELVPQIPPSPSLVEVIYQDAYDKAWKNNKFALNIRRRQLEADYDVAKANGSLRQVNLFAQVGFTGTGADIRRSYDPLKDNQVVEIGVTIPLLDWGKRKGQVKVAESNRQVVESQLRQETQNFNQDLFILVERFNNQQRQLQIAVKGDSISEKRYQTNVETYMIGRLSTLDLNDSQISKDEARKSYVNQLYLYWYYLYQLRSLTLWDYASNAEIEADIEKIIERSEMRIPRKQVNPESGE